METNVIITRVNYWIVGDVAYYLVVLVAGPFPVVGGDDPVAWLREQFPCADIRQIAGVE